ncbi:speckle-type POZ protein A-like [Copidosoma floridanum]|uniref:speckle-type POZ protein A-like n=1 Tax=Copidosoma floridanum TaxID=29053 RepID=UPI0006C948E6|nr:speckle-type POZ protein A-like [Copidosoma floridanum]
MTLYTGEIHQKVVHKWTIVLEEIPEEGSITSPIFKDVGYECIINSISTISPCYTGYAIEFYRVSCTNITSDRILKKFNLQNRRVQLHQITVEHNSIPVSPAEKSSITLEFTFHKVDVRSAEYCLDSDSDSDKKIYDFSTKKFIPLKQHVQSSNDYLVLLNNKNFSDVSIIINDQVIYAHKCILAVKSPVFASMFDTAMIENKANEVRIDDIKYEVLYEMLRFLYTGVVSKLINLAADLFYAADKYGIEQLKIMCVKQLIKNMNADNVIGYVYLADSHSNDLLKNKAIQFIVNNAKDVVQKSEFKELSIQNPIFYEIFKALASK